MWHFPQTAKYDPVNKKKGLWDKYIDYFLRLKTEASGWPPGVTTDQQKKDYIDYFKEHEGISLRPDKIKYNEVLRQLAKLWLNTLWVSYLKLKKKSPLMYCCFREKWHKKQISLKLNFAASLSS